MTANSTGAIIAAAKAGLGAALVPRVLVAASLTDGSLQQIMPRYQGPSPGVSLVYPSRLHPSAALKALIAFLMQEAERVQG